MFYSNFMMVTFNFKKSQFRVINKLGFVLLYTCNILLFYQKKTITLLKSDIEI